MSNALRCAGVATIIGLTAWGLCAYVPALSSGLVLLNVLVAAGQPQLVSLPYAYPAVGMDGHTIVSLCGVLVLAAVATHIFDRARLNIS